jgi:Ca2+-binding RTX toxin-like protein
MSIRRNWFFAVVAAVVMVAAVGFLMPAHSANINGTAGDDPALVGTADIDNINGLGGSDKLTGLAGDDVLMGSGGNDTLVGSEGNDGLFGQFGDDTLYGEAETTSATTGGYRDVLDGGAGNDVIYAQDGAFDLVVCGLGDDFAFVDVPQDIVIGCEHVNTPLP